MQDSSLIKKSRPLSPHLQIYRWQISSVLSILHRITGVILFGFFSVTAWWIVSIVKFFENGPLYAEIPDYKIVWLGLIISSWAGFYHACNGIRHLIWDIGKLFSIKQINYSGWFVVITSILFTVIFWWMIF